MFYIGWNGLQLESATGPAEAEVDLTEALRLRDRQLGSDRIWRIRMLSRDATGWRTTFMNFPTNRPFENDIPPPFDWEGYEAERIAHWLTGETIPNEAMIEQIRGELTAIRTARGWSPTEPRIRFQSPAETYSLQVRLQPREGPYGRHIRSWDAPLGDVM